MGFIEEMLEQEKPKEAVERIYSIVTAIVQENWNEEHKGQIKIKYFMAEEGQDVTDWVPVAGSYAGDGYGTFFLPEIGTEVVVAFNNGNPNCPIVIGSLWNAVNPLPSETANEKNSIKKIKTKAGHEILFDEEEGKEQIEIHTKANLKILLQDETKKITLVDSEEKNKLIIDGEQGEISVTADKKITFEAGGKELLVLDGNAKKATIQADHVLVEAGQGLKIKGQNTNIEGNMVGVKAQGSLKLEASGVTEVKGAMVKLN